MKLIGTTAAGTSTAAWTGMLNRWEGAWDTILCDLVGVEVDHLPPIAPPSEPLTPAVDVGATWPSLAHAAWFAPISDGHSQSIGTGLEDSSQMVLSAATSGALRVLVDRDIDNLPRGLWCNRIDETHSILGGALNDVGRVVTWLECTMRLPEREVIEEMMRGDALHALEILAPGVERAPVDRGETLEPVRERALYYHRRMERFQVLYDKVVPHGN